MNEYQAASRRMNSTIVEFLGGMSVIKMFGHAASNQTAATQAIKAYGKIEREMGEAFIPLGGAFFALIMAGITVIVPLGAWLMAAGTLGLDTFLFFAIVGTNYAAPLLKLFGVFTQFAHISIGATLIEALLRTPSPPDAAQNVTITHHDISVDHVDFAYDAHDVLHDISLTAKAGTVTALVGPSGAGKSTLATLLARFHDPTRGAIRIGGVDLRDIPRHQLISQISFVFQRSYLFSDTIGANIRFGRKMHLLSFWMRPPPLPIPTAKA